MSEEKSDKEWDLSRCNWPGVIAGILLILLPLTGFWWRMHVGSGAFEISLSPFSTEILMFGDFVLSPLLYWLNIAFIILMLLFGIMLLAGSVLFANEKYRITADSLVRINSRKPFYLIIIFTIGLAIASYYIGQTLLMSGFSGDFPILLGEGTVTMVSGGFTITVPVSLGFSTAYWIGLISAIIAIIAGLYQNKISPKEISQTDE